MRLKAAYYDLETGPQPLSKLEMIMPEFTPPKTWKDEDKIRANLEEQRAKWIEDAALSPLTGEIVAAIWVNANGETTIIDGDRHGEAFLIQEIFRRISAGGMGSHYKVIDFNGRSFDRPFLIKRAWRHRIPLPSGFMRLSGKWIDFPPWLIDLRDLWGLDERHPIGSLGALAEFLGVGEKKGEGKDFARKWRGHPEERAEAVAYLLNDGDLLQRITEYLVSLSPDGYGLKLREEHAPEPDTRPQGPTQ